MGLSCGNPNALAALQPGEVVLDLGAGGGFDVFIAGAQSRSDRPRHRRGHDAGDAGQGAQEPGAATARTTGLDNVEFRLGEIEHLPLADHSVDVVISNCVINLSPDKPQVWREIARVLKPGGRVAVSDLALLKPLPAEVLTMVEALVGCVAGAVLVSDTERMAREAGLTDIVLDPKPQYVEAMTSFEDPLYQKIIAQLPAGAKPSDYHREPRDPGPQSPGWRQRRGQRLQPAVNELVAIGAAIAANCEPCLKYHYDQANKLGFPRLDMAQAVRIAATVKDAPHRSILRLADRLTGNGLVQAGHSSDPCCADREESGNPSGCCGGDEGSAGARTMLLVSSCEIQPITNNEHDKRRRPSRDNMESAETTISSAAGPAATATPAVAQGKMRWIICGIVLIAAGVLVVKAMTKPDQAASQPPATAFAAPVDRSLPRHPWRHRPKRPRPRRSSRSRPVGRAPATLTGADDQAGGSECRDGHRRRLPN